MLPCLIPPSPRVNGHPEETPRPGYPDSNVRLS